MQVLAGDIGGTHSRLALVEIENGRAKISHRQTFDSGQFEDLPSMVGPFLDELARPPDRASLAVAGPIVRGSVRLTNLGWTIDVGRIGSQIGIDSTCVLNDFHAVAHGVPHLDSDHLATVRPGEPVEDGPIAVLGAGTGLGVSFLHHDGTRYRVIGSEGGHLDFAPRDEIQSELSRFLRARYRDESGGHVSYERVLSGPGLVAIYDFLVRSGRADDDPEVRQAISDGDAPATIARRAAAGAGAAAVVTLNVFADVYGAMAGNLALLVQASGGVYLSGGIAQQNMWALRTGRFEAAFIDKGRLSKSLSAIPVYLIRRDDVGLLGAAFAAAEP
jgi:glucokinase